MYTGRFIKKNESDNVPKILYMKSECQVCRFDKNGNIFWARKMKNPF